MTVKGLTLTSKVAFFPAETTLIDVSKWEYPIPVLTTTTSLILPSVITGLNLAPVPFPELSITCKVGVEKYSTPPYWILTWSIFPLTKMGFKLESLPFFIEITGFFSKFNILEPYPVPDSYK